MLLANSLKYVVQNLRFNNNKFNKNVVPYPLRANVAQRSYCSEKFKIIDESTPVLTVRRSLKTAGVEATEGCSFIKTQCPVCDFADGTTPNSIYINKVSGMGDDKDFD